VLFLTISYPLTVFFPSKFKWRYDTSMVWIDGHCLFFSLGFLLYLRYAVHVLEYGSQKSSIVTHISTCFLVNFVFCCFLCFLICLLHVPSFSFFRCFHFSFLHFFSRLFNFSCPAFFSWQTITNPDHLHVDPLFSFADLYAQSVS
jgi:hypothetical protein